MAMSDESEDEIDGLDEVTTSNGWGEEYPLDSVFVRREERTVNETVNRIKKNRIQLDPDFQRDFVWKENKASKLIESCLMRIPLPVFYVAEAKDGKIIVVDGLQRLTCLRLYMDNEFALEFPHNPEEKPHPLSGKKFDDLTVTLQERIQDTPLIFYILDSKAPERAKLDIFDRVNSGVPLTRQQMRNCLYSGNATKWLRNAAKSDAFLKATHRLFDADSMRDREAINRFCAFRLLGHEKYKNADMDSFLCQALEHMNTLLEKDLDNLMSEFEHSMSVNLAIFGDHAFRKSLSEGNGGQKRSAINISLFDVCSVILADMPRDAPDTLNDRVRNKMCGLLNTDAAFYSSISTSTTGTKKVQDRFSIARKAFKGILA
jgi:hypothetical protein